MIQPMAGDTFLTAYKNDTVNKRRQIVYDVTGSLEVAMTAYKNDTVDKRRQIVYDVMGSLEVAKRVGDYEKYDYFLKLSQQINNWHLQGK